MLWLQTSQVAQWNITADWRQSETIQGPIAPGFDGQENYSAQGTVARTTLAQIRSRRF